MDLLGKLREIFGWRPTPARMQTDELLDMRRITTVVWPLAILGAVFTLWQCHAMWAVGAVWALACLSVGVLTGFLFGIPRVLQGTDSSSAAAATAAYQQRVNTNLEQISDWLTKIIVGLGLVQLTKVPAYLAKTGELFAASVGQTREYRGFFGAVIVFFCVEGFLYGYLVTRLYLQGALGRADQAAATAVAKPGPNLERIQAWLKVNDANRESLRDWLDKRGVKMTLTTWLEKATEAERDQAIKELKIP